MKKTNYESKRSKAIFRALDAMPVAARHLIIRAVLNVQRPTFSLQELGFFKTEDEIRKAIDLASQEVLRLKGEGFTESFIWLMFSSLDLKNKTVTLLLNEGLYDYIPDIQNVISKEWV
jgi:hypothetical protein